MTPTRPSRRPRAALAAALLAVPLAGCVVAPLHPPHVHAPRAYHYPPPAVVVPPGAVYVAPPHARPAPGYGGSHPPRHGWGWRHPHRGWHRGWH